MVEMREIHNLDGTTVMVPAPKFKAGDVVIFKDKLYSIPKTTNIFQRNPLYMRSHNTWIYAIDPINDEVFSTRVLEDKLTLAYRKD